MQEEMDLEVGIAEDDNLSFNLDEKNERARQEIMAELRSKYGNKINAQRNKIDKELKFMDSMDGDKTVATAKKTAEEFKACIDETELVSVRLDRKTVILVPKHKCEQNENGQWVKKQK